MEIKKSLFFSLSNVSEGEQNRLRNWSCSFCGESDQKQNGQIFQQVPDTLQCLVQTQQNEWLSVKDCAMTPKMRGTGEQSNDSVAMVELLSTLTHCGE